MQERVLRVTLNKVMDGYDNRIKHFGLISDDNKE